MDYKIVTSCVTFDTHPAPTHQPHSVRAKHPIKNLLYYLASIVVAFPLDMHRLCRQLERCLSTDPFLLSTQTHTQYFQIHNVQGFNKATL